MKKAVIVTAYNYPDYLSRFIDQLLRDGSTDVFLHIDRKNAIISEKIVIRPNLYFIKRNVSVSWGGYDLLQGIINSWQEVLEHDSYNWIILCSGQDILLRNDLDGFLDKHSNEIFIDSYEDDYLRRLFLLNKWPRCFFRLIESRNNITRIMRRGYLELLKHGWKLSRRKLNWDTKSMVFYCNLWWSAIPNDVVKWIIEFIKTNPPGLF